jgi:2-dehydro-3-deoxyphosphogluconate aldolase/(4S)-4-hydroxy-2-oxoglutarate aldolase
MLTIAERLKQARIVAIFRGNYDNRWQVYADAMVAGGVSAMEITLNSAGALDGIRQLKATMGSSVLLGAGTVLTSEQAHQAIDAGAEFIVAPDTDEAVIEACLNRHIAVIPGAYSPTEIKHAYQLGATMVKVFPALDPAYIKAVTAPLDYIPIMATGGVSVENIAAYFKAGVSAVGVGSALTKPGLSATDIERNAKALVDAIQALSPLSDKL